jgi:hypothetical protein
MNIQLLTGILLLSLLSATKSTKTGKEKIFPESKGQSADDEYLWPHSGSGELEEMLGTNRQTPVLNESGQRQNQQLYYYMAAPSNVPQIQPTIGQLWHNFEQSIDDGDYNIFGVQQSQLHQRDNAIVGKRKAYEFEEEEQHETWGKGSQHGGDEVKHQNSIPQNWPHQAPQAKKLPKEKTVYYNTDPIKTEPVNFKETVQKCKRLINKHKFISAAFLHFRHF